MRDQSNDPPADDSEVTGLSRQLQDIDRQVQTLSAGEVDAQLSMASRLARMGAWSMELSQLRVLWSDEVCAIHEVPSGTSPTLTEAVEHYPPEYREIVRRAVRNCADLGTPFDMELEILTGRGRRVWVRAMGEAVRDSTGTIRMIQGAFQDLSDRKRAEQETRRLAARLTTTLESLTIGFHTTDRDWRFTYVNAEAERLLGRRREDLIGRTIWEEFPEIIGTDFDRSFRRAVAERRSTTVESQFRPHAPWLRVSAYPSEEGLAVHLRDISIERAERQQLKLLEASVARLNDMLIILDATPLPDSGPRVQFVNNAFVSFTGYSHDEIIGQSRHLLDGPETDGAELERINTALANFDPVRSELVSYKKSGEAYWVELEIAPFAAQGTAYTHFVGVERDITGRKRHDEALNQLNLELEERVRLRTAELTVAREGAEQAARAKSIFLANMSHEIRTPMNGVLGLIEVLSQTNLQTSQSEMVQLIRDSADSLLNIIDDILDFSKAEAGKLRIENAPMRLADVVEKVCGLLDSMANSHNVGLTMFVAPEIPPAVAGDEFRLRQVLINLVGNAIKFSNAPGRPGRVSVRAELVDRQPTAVSVELTVADNGVGIDQETLSRLFKPFSQADASTTRRFGGTGLGLAITDMLVRLMGGTVSVESRLAQGAVFRVRLPFQALPTAAATDSVEAAMKGLQCRIIGSGSQSADDIARYLVSAGAFVERSPNPAHASKHSRHGLWLWLMLPDHDVPSLTALRALAAVDAQAVTRFVMLGCGKCRQPRMMNVDQVGIDLDVLRRGTLFRTLALAAGRISGDDPGSEEQPTPIVGPTMSVDATAQSHSRILIVEDNDTNRQVIQRQLQLLGYGAEMTVDGREALQRWRNADFALVLTDLRMPEMDGYALAAAIRAEEPPGRRTVIVALTANALPEEEARCRTADMDDYLVKPVRLPQLKATLERWLPPGVQRVDSSPTQALRGAIESPVDLAILISQVGDDPSDINAVLQNFRSTSERVSGELNHAIAAGLAPAVREISHRLKSGAASIGARSLGQLCAEIEDVAVSGRTDLLTALWPQFQAQLDVVWAYLDALES